MSKNLKLFKKITLILGVAFLLMGMVPLPGSRITTVSASENEGRKTVFPLLQGVPKLDFTISRDNDTGECQTGCQREHAECGISADGKTCCPGLDCVLFNPASGIYKCAVSACIPSGTCPTTCGYDGTDISDGCGGTIACEPTADCQGCTPSGICPTTCGYDGTDISDGCGGTIACDPTAECNGCDPLGQEICPTACGTPASTPSDLCGGTVQCAATRKCNQPDKPLIIPVTGVDYTIPFAALQQFFMNLGLMLFGVTMVLEGVDQKRKK